jgi:phage tail sheath protein FI
MPELLHPGVYVMEVPSASKPIEGISTSTAGFVGIADRGPVPGFSMPFGARARPPLLTSFAEYARTFGDYRNDSYLTYAVQNFFDNGGKRAYVVRVVIGDDPVTSTNPMPNARVAAAGLMDREANPNPTLAVVAKNPGKWANTVGITVLPATLDPAHSFKLVIQEDGVPVESFDELSMDPASDAFVETVVNSRSTVVMVKAAPPAAASHDDARPALNHVLRLNGDAAAPSLDVSSPVFLGGPLTITTKRDTSGGNPIFSLQIKLWGRVVETFDRLSMNPALGNFVERKINSSSNFVRVAVPPASPPITDYDKARPADGDAAFPEQPLPGGLPLQAGAGLDGRTPDQGDMHYLGRADLGTGLHAFDAVPDVNIIAIPGQGNDLIISGGMAYCKNRPLQDAFFVADLGLSSPANSRQPGATPDVNDKNAARDFVRSLSTPNDYGAIYYPWVRASDPIGSGRNPMILLPPSGFIAGLYARIDNSRGVFKAPAGTETGLAGALGLSDDVHDTDQDLLNPIGLNAIRRFPIYGIVSWGTRTLSADAAWRYIPVRRMAIFLRGSIYNGIQWAVFEPNDEPLWAELRLNIRSFMLTQFRSGAFQGATPADAFFVKCDASTTTQQDIDLGIVNILVGFAPLKPAEFIVLKLSQKVNLPAA